MNPGGRPPFHLKVIYYPFFENEQSLFVYPSLFTQAYFPQSSAAESPIWLVLRIHRKMSGAQCIPPQQDIRNVLLYPKFNILPFKTDGERCWAYNDGATINNRNPQRTTLLWCLLGVIQSYCCTVHIRQRQAQKHFALLQYCWLLQLSMLYWKTNPSNFIHIHPENI